MLISFTEALRQAHDSGWYIYQAWENETPWPSKWGATIRRNDGGYRREIAHGSGETLGQAILSAVQKGERKLEEIQSEANASPPPPDFNIIKALGIKEKPKFVRRI